MRLSSAASALAVLLCTTLSACTTISAEDHDGSSALAAELERAAPLNYLTDDSIDLATAISAPPAVGSPEEQQDLDLVMQAQATRTAEDCARASATDVPTTMTFSLQTGFGAPYGPLTDAEIAAWGPLFDKVRADTKYFIQKAQAQYNRKRPSLVNTAVQPCIALSPTSAYPSGHAAASYVVQAVLSEIDPSRREVFAARAEQITRDRLLSGVHYPTDLVAGRKLGAAAAAAFLMNVRLRADMNGLPRP